VSDAAAEFTAFLETPEKASLDYVRGRAAPFQADEKPAGR
jgi:hypothetical protein